MNKEQMYSFLRYDKRTIEWVKKVFIKRVLSWNSKAMPELNKHNLLKPKDSYKRHVSAHLNLLKLLWNNNMLPVHIPFYLILP